MHSPRPLPSPAWKSTVGTLFMCAFWFGALCSPAAAATINFTNGTYSAAFNNGSSAQPYNTYTEAGYVFQTPQAPGQHLDANTLVLYWHEGGANTVNNVITLTYSGGAFDLLSFDLVELPNNFATFNPALTVTGSNGSQFVTTNEAVGTFSLNWTNLDWVTFDINSQSSGAGNAWMDNVRVQASAVPAHDPATAALLLAGLGALGFARRRSRSAVVTAS